MLLNQKVVSLKEYTDNPQKVEMDINKNIIKIDFERSNVYIISAQNTVGPKIEENKAKNTIFIDMNLDEDYTRPPSAILKSNINSNSRNSNNRKRPSTSDGYVKENTNNSINISNLTVD